ncbi:hypothetical protein GYH30_053578 [Glycine max]|nr:hypothetical protein GYH30_053578 [Glycine max]
MYLKRLSLHCFPPPYAATLSTSLEVADELHLQHDTDARPSWSTHSFGSGGTSFRCEGSLCPQSPASVHAVGMRHGRTFWIGSGYCLGSQTTTHSLPLIVNGLDDSDCDDSDKSPSIITSLGARLWI